MASRRAFEQVDGVLLLDKPSGLSSNTALQRARRLLNAAKAGHTGTLDPLASGLLPLCFGEATKFAQALLDSEKEYEARVRFGRGTTTGDAEGETLAEAPVGFDQAALVAALSKRLGRSLQTPPRHAALKHEGRAYYEYARAGVDIPRTAREIEITHLELLAWDGRDADVRIACSKGTYVRVFAEDLAAGLGTVGHLAALRRTRSGPFRVGDAVTLDNLEAAEMAARRGHLLPIDAPIAGLPVVTLDPSRAEALLQGRTPEAQSTLAGRLRACDVNGRFLGLVEVRDGRLIAIRLVRQPPAAASASRGADFSLES